MTTASTTTTIEMPSTSSSFLSRAWDWTKFAAVSAWNWTVRVAAQTWDTFKKAGSIIWTWSTSRLTKAWAAAKEWVKNLTSRAALGYAQNPEKAHWALIGASALVASATFAMAWAGASGFWPVLGWWILYDGIARIGLVAVALAALAMKGKAAHDPEKTGGLSYEDSLSAVHAVLWGEYA